MNEYIYNVLFTVLELTAILLCYTQVLKVTLSKKRGPIIIVYVGMMLCSVINTYNEQIFSVTIITFIYGFAVIGFLSSKNVLITLLIYPCAYLIESIFGLLGTYVTATIMDIPQYDVANNKIFLIVMLAVTCSIFMAVCLYNIKTKRIKLFFGKRVYIVMTIGAVSFVLVISALQSIGPRYNIPYNQTNLLGVLILSVCVIFFGLFIWLSTARYKNELFQRENEKMSLYMTEQEKYVRLIVEKDEDMRKFRHDVKAHMWALSGYLENMQYEMAKDYICKMYKEHNDAQVAVFTGIVAVDAVIAEKMKEMQNKDVLLDWHSSLGCLGEKYDEYDICTLVVNLLSNAIEACEILPKYERIIKVQWSTVDGELYICQENKCYKNIEFDEYGNPITSKSDKKNHGYGTKNIRNVVEKYDGDLKYTLNEGVFRVEVIV